MAFIIKLLLLILFGVLLGYAATQVAHNVWAGILVFFLFAVSNYKVVKRPSRH